jgi:uncharacterized protein with FMN-binding domain
MKKGIAIILAVAIIGTLGVYGKSHGHPADGQTAPANSVQSDTTSQDSLSGSSDNASGSSSTPRPAGLKDGTYTGVAEVTPYGTVQVAAVVSGGKITNVNFLQMPNDRGHTQEVTAFAQPLLKQETLSKQSAKIDFVSGATQTSEGYQRSLQSALDQAG